MQENWLSLGCPYCRCRFRIKEAYAHLRGRCPECGRRIEPPRPCSALTAGEGGLAPIVEEWPEPPRREEEDEAASYGIAPAEARTSVKPAALEPDSYGLAPVAETPALARDFGLVDDEPPPALAPHEPAAPKAPGTAQRLSYAETHPERAPPPPARPFLDGVYSYPWRRDNLALWLYLTIEISLIVFFLFVSSWVIDRMSGGALEDRVMAIALVLSITSLCILLLASGPHVAAAFLHVVEGTAAGNDRLERFDFIYTDGLGRLLLLSWLFFCSSLPGFVSAKLLPGTSTILAMLASGCLLLPLALLSGLSAVNPWQIVDAGFMARALRKPLALPRFYAGWLALLAVVGASLWLIMVRHWAFLIPIAAVLLSASLLAGARLVGRAAWLLTYEPKRVKPAKDAPAAPALLNVVIHATTCEFPQKELVGLLGKSLAELESAIPFKEKNVELTQTRYDAATHALDGGDVPDLVHRFRRGDGAHVDFLVKDGRIATALLFDDR